MASHSGRVVKSANFAETKIDSGLLHLLHAFLPKLYFPIIVAHCSFFLAPAALFTLLELFLCYLYHLYLFATPREAPIMGKWAVSESVWAQQVYEDHCNGWLWITTPKVRIMMIIARVLTEKKRRM